MSTINAYGTQGSASKGSINNFFTMEEFEEMYNAGTWNGGYVEGISSYVQRNLQIQGSTFIPRLMGNYLGSDSFGSSSDPGVDVNPYPQCTRLISGKARFPSMLFGAFPGTFDYSCPVTISGYTMTIGAVVNPLTFKNRTFSATAVKKVSGQQDVVYVLSPNNGQGVIIQSGEIYIGECQIVLPASGNVEIDLAIGFDYDSGHGHANGATTIHIYPFS